MTKKDIYDKIIKDLECQVDILRKALYYWRDLREYIDEEKIGKLEKKELRVYTNNERSRDVRLDRRTGRSSAPL